MKPAPKNPGISRLRRWLFGPATAALLAAALGIWGGAGSAPAQDPEPLPAASRYVGTGSCAATACHGGRREPLGLKGSEYSFWADHDRHRKAYSVLFGEWARQIERNFRRLDIGQDGRPERDATCLSCHVHSGFEPRMVEREASIVADGVGCESCHGRAERWLVPHTESWWSRLSAQEKQDRFGLTATKDLGTRIRVCAECHIGSRAADVNHDLIAAGHPRLLFEFANQQAKHPNHWTLEADKARDPDFEVRAWALGQVIGTEQSLGLLEHRARDAAATLGASPWPELAEYDCFSCHRELKPKGVLNLARDDGSLRTLPWGVWTLPPLRRLASEKRVPGPFSSESALAKLPNIMSRANVDPAEAAALARRAARELAPLEQRITRERFQLEDVRSLLSGLLQDAEAPRAARWTDAARDYLALVALIRAQGNLGGPSLDDRTVNHLSSLRSYLDLPSVRPTDGRSLNSPEMFESAQYKMQIRSLQGALPHRGE